MNRFFKNMTAGVVGLAMSCGTALAAPNSVKIGASGSVNTGRVTPPTVNTGKTEDKGRTVEITKPSLNGGNITPPSGSLNGNIAVDVKPTLPSSPIHATPPKVDVKITPPKVDDQGRTVVITKPSVDVNITPPKFSVDPLPKPPTIPVTVNPGSIELPKVTAPRVEDKGDKIVITKPNISGGNITPPSLTYTGPKPSGNGSASGSVNQNGATGSANGSVGVGSSSASGSASGSANSNGASGSGSVTISVGGVSVTASGSGSANSNGASGGVNIGFGW